MKRTHRRVIQSNGRLLYTDFDLKIYQLKYGSHVLMQYIAPHFELRPTVKIGAGVGNMRIRNNVKLMIVVEKSANFLVDLAGEFDRGQSFSELLEEGNIDASEIKEIIDEIGWIVVPQEYGIRLEIPNKGM